MVPGQEASGQGVGRRPGPLEWVKTRSREQSDTHDVTGKVFVSGVVGTRPLLV